MIPLTEEENKSHRKEKLCYICKKEFSYNDENSIKLKITGITLENIEKYAHNTCNLRHKMTK